MPIPAAIRYAKCYLYTICFFLQGTLDQDHTLSSARLNIS